MSTSDQSLDGQRDALMKAGAGRLHADIIAGAARHRPELDRLLDQLRPRDVVVTKRCSGAIGTIRVWVMPRFSSILMDIDR